MANRLDIDAHVLAYLGFDEANETDVALDESSYGRNFTVVTSPSVQVARVNNGRQFNGTVTHAYPADSSPYLLVGDMAFIVWITLDQVNSLGSFLRTIIECSGSGTTEEDNCLYGLYVSNLGEIIYRHQNGTKQDVILKTAPNTVRTGRFYSITFRRAVLDAVNCKVELYLDNQPVSWASATGTVEKPSGGSLGALFIGKSNQYADGAFWQGIIDELSLHDVARPYQPYLRGAYYKLTLYSLFYRLTAYNNVKSVGTAEMGGGERWWVYERDQSLYAIRENTLGLFSPEVQLTTTGLQVNGTIGPGGAEKPTVIYDKANDLLVVAFISANKVYRLTASSSDSPTTQQLPLTVDTASIIKVRESNEGIRVGVGADNPNPDAPAWMYLTTKGALKQGAAEVIKIGAGSDSVADGPLKGGDEALAVGTYLTRLSGAPGIAFTGWPSFGIFIPSVSSYGVVVYSDYWGIEKVEGYVISPTYVVGDAGFVHGFYFWPIAEESRREGTRYYVRYLTSDRRSFYVISNRIVDLLGRVSYASAQDRSNGQLCFDRDGDLPQAGLCGAGSGNVNMYEFMYLTTRGALKMGTADPSPRIGAGAGLLLTVSCTATPTAPQRVAWEAA